jgi:hypothetical protein
MNTTKNQQPARGQVVPYADQRGYTDRLNALFTPAGWTRRYAIHTSANFERSKDQKIAAKVLVTCELTIFGLGSHSATGEEWADDDNACTSAEAQVNLVKGARLRIMLRNSGLLSRNHFGDPLVSLHDRPLFSQRLAHLLP